MSIQKYWLSVVGAAACLLVSGCDGCGDDSGPDDAIIGGGGSESTGGTSGGSEGVSGGGNGGSGFFPDPSEMGGAAGVAGSEGGSGPTAPLCGNGALDPDEACDDGNALGGDGCG